MSSEIASKADFSQIRYAQCWEDADILLAGLDIQPGDTCLSIASAGDNALAMLTRNPARVIAVDLNPAQLACLELRVAAFKELTHHEYLQLMGSRACRNRVMLYQKCRPLLSMQCQQFWDRRWNVIAQGIGNAGKFEKYFEHFRRKIIPLIHGKLTVKALLEGGDRRQRSHFYANKWDNLRWRLLFRIFFSRFVMGRLGRDPQFFAYVEGSVSDRILQRTRHALTELNPADNPYLHWILLGTHGPTLPLAWREENFEVIRANLHKLEWHCQSLEDCLQQTEDQSISRFNLSDIFEYMSQENYRKLLLLLLQKAKKGGRLAFWNMLVPRSRPQELGHRLNYLAEESQALHLRDKAFFYSAFLIEEVIS